MTAVHFSKQNSTFVAEFNSNLKIPGGGARAPHTYTSATDLKIELNRIDFLMHCFFFLLSEVFLKIIRVFPSLQKPKLLCCDLV